MKSLRFTAVLLFMLMVMIAPQMMLAQSVPDYLTFTSEENGSTVSYMQQYNDHKELDLKYSYDGVNWNSFFISWSDPTVIKLNKGESIRLKGNNTYINSDTQYGKFVMTGKIAASGNVLSLINFSEIIPYRCFDHLFAGCASLTKAPKIGTENTQLQHNESTGLGLNYESMFLGCEGLTEGPEIPNMELVNRCFQYAFFSCENLNHIKVYFKKVDNYLPFMDWMSGVSPNGVFEGPCVLEADKGKLSMPSGWTFKAFHDLERTPAINATCTTDGNIEYYTCKDCHKYFSDAEGQHEIAENSWIVLAHHNRQLIEETAATCTTDGNEAYYYCPGCGAYSSDAEGLHEIAENSWVRPALGHDWEDIYDEEHYTWTHHCKHDAAHDIHRKQLCFEAKEDNSELGWGELSYEKIYNLQYSLNWSDEWTNLEAGEYVKLNTGDKIWVRCNTSQSFEMGTFNMNGKFEASGSIMSMINNQPDLTVIPYEKCFFQMFNQRSCLTKAPALPATTLTKGCYSSMFQNSGLVTAPVLPAETLAENCYESMFSGCSDLVSAPVLPAETLVKGCYRSMFASCENLASLTLNAKDVSAEGCIDGFLDNNRFLNPVKGILHITDELAFSNVNLQLPSNWSSDKVGIHAKEDPDNKGDYYATFYKGEGEYTVPEGTKAYTGVIEGGVLEMTAEANNIIPAGEGVLLKGNTADYILTLSDTNKPQTPGNALRGSDKDVNAPEGVYIFTYGQKGLGFYKYAVNGVLSANKAYLQTVIGSAKAYPMVFGGGVTGMDNILAPSKGNGAIYNLQGVRLNKLQKGINIVNGKKVFVK